MAQVVAHDGTRLLLFTRSEAPHVGQPVRDYGRILDLSRMVVWPELLLGSLLAHGQWEPLDDPVPADALLARARVVPIR